MISARGFRRRRLLQLGNDRNQKRGRLAGTGLGPADGVLTAQGITQHLGLDRRAVREAEVLNGMHQLVAELEVVEAGLAFLSFDDKVFQLPQAGLWLGLAFAARLGLRRLFAARREDRRNGNGRLGVRLNLVSRR